MLAPPMTARAKILLGLLLLFGVLALGYLVFRAETCRRVIAEQSSLRPDPNGGGVQGLSCSWRVGHGQPTETTPTLWQVICGARPVEVYLNNRNAIPPVTVERARKMAEALRFFGSLEEISVQGAGDEAMELFMRVGRQPNLTKAFSFRVPITDEINTALRGFPRLRDLGIGTSEFTGRRFAYLPELETADFGGSPISLDGLAAIANSPKLKSVSVSYYDLTQPQFQAIEQIRAQHPNLEGLEFDPPKQAKAE